MLTRREGLLAAAAAGMTALVQRHRCSCGPTAVDGRELRVPKGRPTPPHVVGQESRYGYIRTSRYRLEPAEIEDMAALIERCTSTGSADPVDRLRH